LAKIIDNYIANNEKNIIMPPYPEALSNRQTFILLLHHIDLIYHYYVNRYFIEEEEQKGIERWMDAVFFRWVESDYGLLSDFQTILKSGDLYSDCFIEWIKLKDARKIYEKKIIKKTDSIITESDSWENRWRRSYFELE